MDTSTLLPGHSAVLRYYVVRNRQLGGFRYSTYRREAPGAEQPRGAYLGGTDTRWGARRLVWRDKRRIARGVSEKTTVWEG